MATKYTYHANVTFPGNGWIEPIMDEESPLIEESIALEICERLNEAALDREDAHDIEAAAKTLAECMDYPWEPMPEKGREAMRNHAKRVIGAARAAAKEKS